MGICDSHRFAFVHVPKAAGESVHSACRDAGLRLRAMDFHMTAMQLKVECDWDRYFTFAVVRDPVRNPWDRMVSGYSGDVNRIGTLQDRPSVDDPGDDAPMPPGSAREAVEKVTARRNAP